ncbi:putative ribonuclease H-like domain-containing protein [Tanacetum coccineum]|uniref:Ribonuclease H-like domain-containing protein n=1 Tax=Tanacetum coccineum TaxID=301880 RepID=A0ABQ5FH39_9ASTR
MTKSVTEHAMFSSVQQRTNHKDFQNCLFACFLSQEEPKKTLMDLPNGKRAIGTKWVYKNKKDERAIRLFLAYASFKDFVVYQMDVKSAFLYGKIEKEVYVCQPPGFEDPDFPNRVYKVEKALYGLHQAPRAWNKGDILLVQVYVDDIIFGSTKKSLCTEFKKVMHKKFQMSSIGELIFFLRLQVKQKEDGIFISQDKYVSEILKKFGFSDVKTASTPMETHKPLLKDADGKDVDEHLYRSMIRSLMYLTSLRPDIMFAVCQPKLGLWYLKDSPFDLVAYTDSDYAGASLDRKSTRGGCQFLGYRLISWQCKKQTVVANSTTETKIHIDNESTICIVKNHVFHSKTKHIEIRHHFIRDSYEKKLIQMIKIHTDPNVADLLTKAFDVSKFQYLIAKKPTESAGFEEIVDFLNAHIIKYALTINPTIYTSCIEQFWATAKVKTINGEVQLQALVDKKKVIITESTIRIYLQLEDAEGTECLPTATIFEELTRMGFVQLFVNQQLGDMSHHKKIFVTPSHTKKIFANMKKEGKGFSRTITPLFQSLMVQAQKEMGEGSANHIDPYHTPTITQPSTSQSQKKQPRRKQRKDTKVSQPSGPIEHMADETENVKSKVLDLETSKTTHALEIESLKGRVKKLEKKQRLRTHKLRRLYKVGLSSKVISSDDKASLGDQEDASKQGRKILDIDTDEDITLDSTHFDIDPDMFEVHDLHGDEVFVETEKPVVNVATTTSTIPVSTATTTDKGKAKMTEPKKPLKKKDQIMYDQEVALNLQAQLQAKLEEERLARQKEE